MVISVDKFLKQRDTDAALYLLSRMLDIGIGEKKREMEELRQSIQKKGALDPEQGREVVRLYHEVVG